MRRRTSISVQRRQLELDVKRLANLLAALTALTMGMAIAGERSQAELAKQATVTRAQAEQTALAKVPGGKVQSAEIEQERGHLVWSFDISQPGTRNIREILVDAKSGRIIHSETETPKDQAEEAAAERKEAKQQ